MFYLFNPSSGEYLEFNHFYYDDDDKLVTNLDALFQFDYISMFIHLSSHIVSLKDINSTVTKLIMK